MATLLESLRQKLENPQQTPIEANSTGAAQSLLATKLTGKLAPQLSTEPREAPIEEQAAIEQTRAQLANQRLDSRVKSQQLAQQSAEQEQQAKIQKQQLDQEGQLKQEQALNQANQLWNNFQTSGKQLDNEKSIADLEQVGFMIRLNNKQYVDKIQGEAAKQGLNNDMSFKEQYYTQAFQDDSELFQDSLAFKKLIDSDNRTFVQEMSAMDNNFAIDLAKQANREANLGAMYSSLGNSISGGLEAYDAYAKKKAAAPAAAPSTNSNTVP